MIDKNRLVEQAIRDTRKVLKDGTFAEDYPNAYTVADMGIQACAKQYEVEVTQELKGLLLAVWLSSMAVQATLMRAEPIHPTTQ